MDGGFLVRGHENSDFFSSRGHREALFTMRSELLYSVGENDAGKQAVDFLSEHGFSRNMTDAVRKIQGALTIDGKEASLKCMLQSGSVLSVKLPPEKRDEWIIPQDLPLQIVYEDEDLLVIDKPAGLLVHPTKNHVDGTLANALAFYFDCKNEPFTFRVVNRLDQDTSGLLIIPRHAFCASILGRDLAERKIRRVYLAAATGDIRNVFPSGKGVIDAPIARVPGEGMLRKVDFEHGESARTHVRLLSYNEGKDSSLCTVRLESGRTHQIRVHFQYIGHPLPGDFLYNPDYRLIGRQALHSYQLTFRQPFTGQELTFRAPLPEDMGVFLDGKAQELLKEDIILTEESKKSEQKSEK